MGIAEFTVFLRTKLKPFLEKQGNNNFGNEQKEREENVLVEKWIVECTKPFGVTFVQKLQQQQQRQRIRHQTSPAAALVLKTSVVFWGIVANEFLIDDVDVDAAAGALLWNEIS